VDRLIAVERGYTHNERAVAVLSDGVPCLPRGPWTK
jgi:hypothetical protein